MKKLTLTLLSLLFALTLPAQEGWPSQYGGVMLQGFYWDSYTDSRWTTLEAQADELAQYFSLIWIPQSANCGGTSMGYDDLYWFSNYNSSFGNEAQLRSMISTFRQKGLGTIADVVINHRKNVSNWVDFPKETYKGVTYELLSTDICANDDGGATATWASKNGYSLSTSNDTGTDWPGMRDLDHTSANVQANVKAYLDLLLNDLGYAGVRYDMVKGYAPQYTRLYNEAAKLQFSVGECWDGTTTIRNWIDGTGKTSAAFDFQFRYTVRNAINRGNWTSLDQQNEGNWPLVSNSYNNGSYRRYAVTFVENHDTEYRSASEQQDPIRKDTLAANAYLLAMPGTPCVFLKHWQACKRDIKAMIDVRRAAGIHNESTYQKLASQSSYYAAAVDGTNGQLVVAVGNRAAEYEPTGDYTCVLKGYHYAYWLSNQLNTAWADLSSGEYEGAQQVTLSAVSNQSGVQLVYTTDGTEPTAASTKVQNGTQIEVAADMTLKVGLLVGTTVSGVITRTYTMKAPPVYRDITVYVQDPGWSKMFFYTWGDNGALNGGWPGKQQTTKTTIDGAEWYSQTFSVPETSASLNIIFNNGNGGDHNQTIDIENVTATTWFTIGAENSSNRFTVTDVTSQHTGIRELTTEASSVPLHVYSLDGRQLRTLPAGSTVAEALAGLPHGLYIVNQRKFQK